jgi:hypothetical protein
LFSHDPNLTTTAEWRLSSLANEISDIVAAVRRA